MKIKKFLFIAFLLPTVCYGEVKAQSTVLKHKSAETLAREIAKHHNAYAERIRNNWILSTSAKSIGNNVFFNYVVNTKNEFPLVSNAKEYAYELRNDVIQCL